MKDLFSRIGNMDAFSSTITYFSNGIKGKLTLIFDRLEDSDKYCFYIGGNAAANEYILKATKKHEVKRDEFNFVILRVRRLMQSFNPMTAKIDIRLAELEKEKAELEKRFASIEVQIKELENQREEKLFQKGGDPYEERKINF